MKTSKRKNEVDQIVKKNTKKSKTNTFAVNNIFENSNVYILPHGSQISKLQIKLWSDKIRLGGGKVSDKLNSDITHIVYLYCIIMFFIDCRQYIILLKVVYIIR